MFWLSVVTEDPTRDGRGGEAVRLREFTLRLRRRCVECRVACVLSAEDSEGRSGDCEREMSLDVDTEESEVVLSLRL